ncbi:MAG: FecR domain-containing protein [Candidatus Omnitrophica bacterium]|nr:FecR domain-containing protein [Candidatus Omnitrophota bacterium]
MRTINFIFCAVSAVGILLYANISFSEPTVLACSGDVKIVRSDSVTGYACEPKMVLKTGDWITTSGGAYVEISFDSTGKNISKLEENTLVVLKNTSSEKLELFDGQVVTSLQGMNGTDTFTIKCPAGLCTAMGTGWSVSTDGVDSDIKVFDSKVYFRSINKTGTVSNEKIWIEQGYSRKIRQYETPQEMVQLSSSDLENLKNALNVSSSSLSGGSDSGASGIVEVGGVGMNVGSAGLSTGEASSR